MANDRSVPGATNNTPPLLHSMSSLRALGIATRCFSSSDRANVPVSNMFHHKSPLSPKKSQEYPVRFSRQGGFPAPISHSDEQHVRSVQHRRHFRRRGES